MSDGQDPYDEPQGFTPYQPDATPESEPGEGDAVGAETPYVPYGQAGAAASFYAATTTTATTTKRSGPLPWLIGIGVVVLVCGGVVAGIVGLVSGFDFDSPLSEEVYVNDLEVGQCLRGGGFATDEPITGLEVVECSNPHDAQVLAVKILSEQEAADYELDDDSQIDVNCRDQFASRDRHLLMREDLTLIAFTETEAPVGGDHVACLLANADGSPLEGDFRDEMTDPS